ncbi:MAG: histidine--tRNA ligase [Oscillospiraceae bacterium]|nr:histidine--tRNA ligase [Oscillospiraceae bacterium]
MAPKYRSIRGTRDILPGQSEKWRYVEQVALEVAAGYGISEIRIPTFEKTELFTRSVGQTTDVVQKEMYTFDKGRESITLRPEGTAGTLRAVLENSMLSDVLPLKLSYIVSCFRHDNPQAGRFREFVQFGIECLGNPSPSADAEVIGVAYDILAKLEVLDGLSLRLNSIGCIHCRPAYRVKLKEYFAPHEDALCKTCLERLEHNPLRLLDCKEEKCRALVADAPKISDGYLCTDCREHFDGLKSRLDAIGLDYEIDPFIVRGLDYYSKTVFEFVSPLLGAQATVCGGGRYDGLIGELGGPHTPALGFGMGLDRLLMMMEATGSPFPAQAQCNLYIGSMGEAANIKSLELATDLRRAGYVVLCDTVGRSVKAQMRYADKMGAAYSCILGEQELEQNTLTLKRMDDGQTVQVALTAEAVEAEIRN